jgi:hypothetical protein
VRTSTAAWAALLAAVLLGGCSPVSLKTETADDVVLERRTQVLDTDRAHSEIDSDGLVLRVRTTAACELAEVSRVKRTERLVADEDLGEEIAVLVLGSIPLTTGTVLLADSGNVYPDDRNARLYNPVGHDDTVIAGAVLVGAGALITALPVIQLIRIAAAGETREQILIQHGEVIRDDVPCPRPPPPVRAPVEIVVGKTTVSTAGTDGRGELWIDLPKVIPPAALAETTRGELRVAGKKAADLDLTLVAEEQRRRGLAPTPTTLAVDPTILGPGPSSGRPGPVPGPAAPLSTDPADRARDTCRTICVSACKGDQTCSARCLEEACR